MLPVIPCRLFLYSGFPIRIPLYTTQVEFPKEHCSLARLSESYTISADDSVYAVRCHPYSKRYAYAQYHQFTCLPWNGTPIELNNSLASLSLVAVVHTTISIPGIILGGYLEWPANVSMYTSNLHSQSLVRIPAFQQPINRKERLTHHSLPPPPENSPQYPDQTPTQYPHSPSHSPPTHP